MKVLPGTKHCWNEHAIPIILFSREFKSNWVWKVWFSLTEILRLFVNTLTADEKYSRSIKQKLQQPFQSPLSKKQKAFSGFFIAFLKFASNFEHFQKKDESPGRIISEIIDFNV